MCVHCCNTCVCITYIVYHGPQWLYVYMYMYTVHVHAVLLYWYTAPTQRTASSVPGRCSSVVWSYVTPPPSRESPSHSASPSHPHTSTDTPPASTLCDGPPLSSSPPWTHSLGVPLSGDAACQGLFYHHSALVGLLAGVVAMIAQYHVTFAWFPWQQPVAWQPRPHLLADYSQV